MSPSLEGIMFNRNANLSARRPLLVEAQKPLVVPPRAPPRDTGPRRPVPPARNVPDYPYEYRPDYWKPSNVELEKRLQESRAREKVGYFQDKVTSPELSLDRREAELVFKFDPHASAEYLSSQYRAPTVHYAKPATPVNGFSNRVPERDGPFVFGVHSPSQFPIPRRDDDDYDYSEVAEENGRTAVRDDVSEDLNCCDKVNEWTVRDKKCKRTLNRMFQIKDRRKVKGSNKEKIKCVLVGDGAVGKSSLIAAYAQNKFREEYQPTAYDTFNVAVDVDDRPVRVEICDTAGQDSMSKLRELCYPGTDVLMLCFSVVRPETFRSVAEKWTKSVAGVNAPLILVGTQSDLALDPRVLQSLRARGEHPVTETEARALAAKIDANYIETSAKTRKQLKDAFDAAILAGLPVRHSRKPFWKKLFCMS
ncbi:ras and EF-hand domain-containing protein-like [Plodia interpunctella]|uniref:ras and EF-hand domain-containing protein-like n=1 Tax=Plodia interpunctella TaxID=58824 RepID=UPI00236877B7|nr:ras and EF-hand domain-containing protein-like [Plodia interpunctella]